MAQVMRFHEFPNSYTWADMPDDRQIIETARLMKEIGKAVFMQYSCRSSGAYMNDTAATLENDFGYGNVNFSSFNRDGGSSEIRVNKSVILNGYHTRKKKYFLFWCSYSHRYGHA